MIVMNRKFADATGVSHAGFGLFFGDSLASHDLGTAWQTVPEEPRRVNDFRLTHHEMASRNAPLICRQSLTTSAATHLDGTRAFALLCVLAYATLLHTLNLRATNNRPNRIPAYDTDKMARGPRRYGRATDLNRVHWSVTSTLSAPYQSRLDRRRLCPSVFASVALRPGRPLSALWHGPSD